MAARFETQFTIVLSTWSTSNTWLYSQRVFPQPSSLVILEDHPLNDPWVKSIKSITVDTSQTLLVGEPNPSIRHWLQLVHPPGYPILRAPRARLRSLKALPPPQKEDECVDKEENSECVIRRRQLVAAAFTARPPPEHWWFSDEDDLKSARSL